MQSTSEFKLLSKEAQAYLNLLKSYDTFWFFCENLGQGLAVFREDVRYGCLLIEREQRSYCEQHCSMCVYTTAKSEKYLCSSEFTKHLSKKDYTDIREYVSKNYPEYFV